MRPIRFDIRRISFRGGSWGVGLPEPGVLAGRDNRGPSGSDGVVAFAGFESAIGGDGCDLLFGRDLVGQPGKHRSIAHVAGSEPGGTDCQRFSVDPDIYLTPEASPQAGVPASVPLAFTLSTDPSSPWPPGPVAFPWLDVEQQMQGAV
jgi:hypothetical protein